MTAPATASPAADTAPDRTRDRSRTEEAILAAARDVLIEKGFGAWGVNAIARAARCDKQLIYRYFGGLDGLAEALGTDVARAIETALSVAPAQPAASYAELVTRLLEALVEVLRGNPLMQRIIAWELSEPNALTQSFAQARSRALAEWIARLRGDLAPPASIDAPAINAVLIAAVQQMVLGSAATGNFAGLPLRDESDWNRVRLAIRSLAMAAYANGDPA
jgi:AcrR family transcriptional regulator